MTKEMASQFEVNPGDLAWDAAHGAHYIWQNLQATELDFCELPANLMSDDEQTDYDVKVQRLTAELEVLSSMAAPFMHSEENPHGSNPFPTWGRSRRPIFRTLSHLSSISLGRVFSPHERLVNILKRECEDVTVHSLESYRPLSDEELRRIERPRILRYPGGDPHNLDHRHIDMYTLSVAAGYWRQQLEHRQHPRGLGVGVLAFLDHYVKYVFEEENLPAYRLPGVNGT